MAAQAVTKQTNRKKKHNLTTYFFYYEGYEVHEDVLKHVFNIFRNKFTRICQVNICSFEHKLH